MKQLLSLLALVFSILQAAHADTLHLYAAAGVKSPAEDIIAAFEARTGHQVVRLYDTAGEAEARFVAAGKVGVLVTTDVRITKAASAGGALAGGTVSRVGDTLAGVAISKAFAASYTPQAARGVASKAIASKIIASADDLKAALQAAKRIAFSDPARGATVGVHFAGVIDKLGIKDAVMAKAVIAKDGIETMKLVASGAADIGITQMSEILQADASLLMGAFPVELELATRYNSWISADASAAVQELTLAFSSADGRAALAKHGLRLP